MKVKTTVYKRNNTGFFFVKATNRSKNKLQEWTFIQVTVKYKEQKNLSKKIRDECETSAKLKLVKKFRGSYIFHNIFKRKICMLSNAFLQDCHK